MPRLPTKPLLLAAILLPVFARADNPPIPAPMCNLQGDVGDQLRLWAVDHSAAGNTGDTYDNRDRGHSPFNTADFPQLTTLPYTEEQRKAGLDWGAQRFLQPGIVFGNSSTASGVLQAGSNPRIYYSDARGLPFIYGQYIHSNLYIYPCHQDQWPGHNGGAAGGYHAWGDVYPTNTPCLIISLGSSFSDKPFMEAVAATLAALRPEVKHRLDTSGMLMPTIQMLLRLSSRAVVTEKDYLTGKAHPTAFDGNNVDTLKMIRLAHAITNDTIPPLAQIKIVHEDTVEPDKDFFDAFPGEALGECPVAVGRIYRSTAPVRKYILSAESSVDINRRPLTFSWVVLRDTGATEPNEKVKIRVLNAQGTQAEVTIPYHARCPIAPGEPLESNRVDVGVFANNGAYYSPPAFFTNFSLDSEARAYAPDGRILEVGYGVGEPSLVIANFGFFFDALREQPRSPTADLLVAGFTAEQINALQQVGDQYVRAKAALDAAELALHDAEKTPGADTNTLGLNKYHATVALDDLTNVRQPNLPAPIHLMLEGALAKMVNDPNFCAAHAPLLKDIMAAALAGPLDTIESEHRRLISLGIIRDLPGSELLLAPLRPAIGPDAPANFTPFEHAALARYNGELIAALLYPRMVSANFHLNYVDYRLACPKFWRDVYHYDAQGHLLGWTRYDLDRTMEFTHDGAMMTRRDAQGRCLQAQVIHYERNTLNHHPEHGAEGWGAWQPLRAVETNQTLTYTYQGADDLLGQSH